MERERAETDKERYEPSDEGNEDDRLLVTFPHSFASRSEVRRETQ